MMEVNKILHKYFSPINKKKSTISIGSVKGLFQGIQSMLYSALIVVLSDKRIEIVNCQGLKMFKVKMMYYLLKKTHVGWLETYFCFAIQFNTERKTKILKLYT